ncbi:TetR/AcrR family transcriptional regulator [Streptomyces sp. NPDC055078]
MTTKSAGPTTRRPRDRKAQILAAAMECFRREGYQATGMEDIAAAVGITAGALYRHFRGKRELLTQALLDVVGRALALAQEADDLDSLIRALGSFSLGQRAYTVVADREARNLLPEDRVTVREQQRAIVGTVATALRTSRPGLGTREAELLAWAVIAAVTSPSYHHVDVPRPRFESLLVTAAEAVCRARVPAESGTPPAPTAPDEPGLVPVARREALIAVAIPLFKASGFQAVSMEDIGAAAGVSRPAVYTHFAAKADLLAAALHRESEVKWHTLTKDLAQSRTADEALARVVETYAHTAVANEGAKSMTLMGELAHLSKADQELLHRSQVDYVTEWATLLMTCRPGLDIAEARATVHAALTVLNLLPRLPLLQHWADPTEIVSGIAGGILGVGPSA